MADRTEDELELAHALYTVWMHAGSPEDGLIAARVRGSTDSVPWLLAAYPQLEVLRGG